MHIDDDKVLKVELEEFLNKDLVNAENCKEHQFSVGFEEKMQKLIRLQSKPYFKFICTTGRRIACILIIFAVAFTSTLSVKAVRQTINEFITNIFDDHTEIKINNNSLINQINYETQDYTILNMPKGFELASNMEEGNRKEKQYINGDKYIRVIERQKENYSILVNSECYSQKNYFDDCGNECKLYFTNDNCMLIIDDTNAIYRIYTNLDVETVEKICIHTK